jgi:integrase
MPVYRKTGRGPETWRVTLGSRATREEWIVHGSKREAETFEAQKKLERASHGPPRARQAAADFATFCVERYWPHAKTHLRASTLKIRRYQLESLEAFFGGHKLTAITTEEVEKYKEHRLATVSAVTVNTELQKLQAVLTYAEHLKVPHATPTILPLPEKGKSRTPYWSDAQVAALFDACEKLAPELVPIVVFLANTGCRPGEALALEWRCVDFEARKIWIEPNEEWQPKDNEARDLPFSDVLVPWLTGERKSPRWVFPNRDGERWASWPKLAFNRVRAAAGHHDTCDLWRQKKPAPGTAKLGPRECTCGAKSLEGGPYMLRHTYASHFIRDQKDLALLADMLGHSKESTTKLYAHIMPSHSARAMNAVSFAPRSGPARLKAAERWGAAG